MCWLASDAASFVVGTCCAPTAASWRSNGAGRELRRRCCVDPRQNGHALCRSRRASTSCGPRSSRRRSPLEAARAFADETATGLHCTRPVRTCWAPVTRRRRRSRRATLHRPGTPGRASRARTVSLDRAARCGPCREAMAGSECRRAMRRGVVPGRGPTCCARRRAATSSSTAGRTRTMSRAAGRRTDEPTPAFDGCAREAARGHPSPTTHTG